MSSEIYELMKRSDEAAVVEKAHRRPRFVEDCVREAIGGVVERFGAMGDGTFVMARQENLETIHQHNVVAERFGLLGELRHELATGEHAAAPHVDARLARRRRLSSAHSTPTSEERRRGGRRGPWRPPLPGPRSRSTRIGLRPAPLPPGRGYVPGDSWAGASWGSAPC